MSIEERADKLFEYVTGPKVKQKLEALIEEYNQNKEDVNSLLEIKDQFNALSFHLSEVLAKAREIESLAELEAQNKFNDIFDSLRGEINETTGKNYTLEDAKYKARLLNSPNYLTHIYAERGHNYIKGYYYTCKNYRDNCLQRISLFKEGIFSSRQEV